MEGISQSLFSSTNPCLFLGKSESSTKPVKKNVVCSKQDRNSDNVLQSSCRPTKLDVKVSSCPTPCQMSKDNSPLTMVAALQQTASKYPYKGIKFFEESQQINFLSYADLYKADLDYKTGLDMQGLKKHSFVILLISKPRKLIPIWWGCVLIGIVPTIVAKAVSYREYLGTAEKLYHVWTTLNHACIITNEAPEDIKLLSAFCSDFNNAQVIALSSLQCAQTSDTPATTLQLTPNDLLFLQLYHQEVLEHQNASKNYIIEL